MRTPLYPSLYQINTRVWLTELSQALGRPATLDDIPDAELDRAAEIGFDWIWLLHAQDGQRRLVVVNYAGNQSQCFLRLPFPELGGRTVRLKDLVGPASYDRDGSDLLSRGLYLDLAPWGYHVFEVTAV